VEEERREIGNHSSEGVEGGGKTALEVVWRLACKFPPLALLPDG